MPKPKRQCSKRTLSIEDELWKRFLTYVVKKHGEDRHTSEEVEQALKEYLDKHEKVHKK